MTSLVVERFTCRKCKHEGPREEFAFNGGGYAESCKPCRREVERLRYKENARLNEGVLKTEHKDVRKPKVCCHCQVLKPIEEFHSRIDKRCTPPRVRLQAYCRLCVSERNTVYMREYRRKNPEKTRKQSRDSKRKIASKAALAEKLLYRGAQEYESDEEKVAYTRGYMAGREVVEGEAKKVEECSDLVFRIAKDLKTDTRLSWDDLVQAGYAGLLEAIRRYRPMKKASLRTFAAHRIRGAIRDEIRARHPASMGDLRRAPDMHAVGLGQEGDEESPGGVFLTEGSVSLSDGAFAVDASNLIQDIERLLGERTARLWKLRGEGWTLEELGSEYGLDQSRISQILNESREQVAGLAQGLL